MKLSKREVAKRDILLRDIYEMGCTTVYTMQMKAKELGLIKPHRRTAKRIIKDMDNRVPEPIIEPEEAVVQPKCIFSNIVLIYTIT